MCRPAQPKLRVLYLITDLQQGGTPGAVQSLACGLDRQRFEPHVCCLSSAGPVAEQIQARGVRVTPLSARGTRDIRVFFRLKALIRQFRPDVLHCYLAHANFVGRVVGTWCRVPLRLASIRTAEMGARWHLWLERLSWRLGRYVICNSESVAQHTHRFSRVPISHIRVIPNGIQIDRFTGATPAGLEELNLDPARKVICFVGRFDSVKDVGTLIEAFKIVGKVHDAQLLLVGDGPMMAQWRQLAEENSGVGNGITFVGWRDDVPSLLKVATIFVLPSRWEGMPNALMEAMAAGCAVVATDVAGCRDLVTDQATGLLVPPGDVPAMAHAIKSLLSDPTRADQLARQAQAHVAEHYSLEQHVQAHQHLYQKVR